MFALPPKRCLIFCALLKANCSCPHAGSRSGGRSSVGTESAIEKVIRYEAHLSRGLYKAMHDLEALQARRLGGSAPL
jgi:hypothetical protein